MGCDIHLYIEYKPKKPSIYSGGVTNKWSGFGGRINPGRNYALFALMANVRNSDPELPVIVSPRGMPEDAAYSATADNRIYVSENVPDGEHTVTMERASQWVKSGSSHFIYNMHGKPSWVTNPDWHSHSWLTTSEFETVLNKYLELETEWHKTRVAAHKIYVQDFNVQPNSWAYEPPAMSIEPEYQAVLASMKQFEKLEYDARIVFWFDN